MRSFAIVPAAGRSIRMGRPKLLLPWGGSTVIETVLHSWLASRIDGLVVVTRASDVALAEACRAAARGGRSGESGGERLVLVHPDPDPVDMKASVAAGLNWLAANAGPAANDVWLLAPADLPTLDRRCIDAMLAAAAEHPGEICAPLQEGRRGHPVVFPWRLADEVGRLGESDGVNRLLSRHEVRDVALDGAAPSDLDTPADYARMVERRERR